jgi:hypothetical protein
MRVGKLTIMMQAYRLYYDDLQSTGFLRSTLGSPPGDAETGRDVHNMHIASELRPCAVYTFSSSVPRHVCGTQSRKNIPASKSTIDLRIVCTIRMAMHDHSGIRRRQGCMRLQLQLRLMRLLPEGNWFAVV